MCDIGNDAPVVTEIELKQFSAETAIVEKYQAFSAEILRLSLLGIAVPGLFIENLSSLGALPTIARKGMLAMIGLAAFAFALSAAAALANRYYFTESLFHRLQMLNRRKSVPGDPQLRIRDKFRLLILFRIERPNGERLFRHPQANHQSMMESAVEIALTFNGVAVWSIAAAALLMAIAVAIAVCGYCLA